MIISNLCRTKLAGRLRVSASVTWEDYYRPSQKIYFDVSSEFEDALSDNPDAFLIGAAIPAMHFGEKRIKIDCKICPQVKTGLTAAMMLLNTWYNLKQSIPVIEADARESNQDAGKIKRSAFFFSGGIDSLATLRMNRLNYPLTHPGSIRDGILIYGLDIISPESHRNALNLLKEIAADADIALVSVYTNIRDLNIDWQFWENHWQGSVLSAVAHILSNRIDLVYIAASDDLRVLKLLNRTHLVPYGSHPMLDSNFSSSYLRVRHDGVIWSRLDKTKIVAGWDLGLKNIRVCNDTRSYADEKLNCGACEKCLRTMLHLLSIGAYEKFDIFRDHDLSLGKIKDKLILTESNLPYYIELPNQFRLIGRTDIANMLESKINDINSTAKRIRSTLGKIDDQLLMGSVSKLKNRISMQ